MYVKLREVDTHALRVIAHDKLPPSTIPCDRDPHIPRVEAPPVKVEQLDEPCTQARLRRILRLRLVKRLVLRLQESQDEQEEAI